jgi:hypothetical protein
LVFLFTLILDDDRRSPVPFLLIPAYLPRP